MPKLAFFLVEIAGISCTHVALMITIVECYVLGYVLGAVQYTMHEAIELDQPD